MKYIAYYRVSTKKQGASGLGLEAQKEAVTNYIAPELIDAEFTEIETGTNKKYRPELAKAIELCKKHNATLLIAKLDRLARNVSFVSNLMESKVSFTAVDMPEANELTIHLLSAIAQNEAKNIQKRIKEALAVKKRQLAKEGKKLGTEKNLTQEGRLKGVETRKEIARNNANNKRARAFIQALNGLTLQQTADKLNEAGFKTSRGGQFSPTQVSRLR
ncbi:MAG: resolvase [Fluviicola sp. XM-24bin1]|nr:MAG: resolvase [Fluviicola sp. XM-24bin1]